MNELQLRLAEVVDSATKGGKNAIAKLEGRIRELEMELSSCQMRTSETAKAYQKSERKIKELQFQADEDAKNQEKMGELATKLQEKIRTYKKQIEEAEEIAALNLAKFRKAQQVGSKMISMRMMTSFFRSWRRRRRGARWRRIRSRG